MKKNADVILGAAMAGLTWFLSHPAESLAIVTGLLGFGVMALRFRKEWRHRND